MSDSPVNCLATTPLRVAAPPTIYRGYMRGMPDLYVLRLPPQMWRGGLLSTLNDKYKVLFVESASEEKEVEAALDVPIQFTNGVPDFRNTIDRVMSRQSAQQLGKGLYGLYVPESEEWPFIVMCRLPHRVPNQGFARQRYGYDAFKTEATATAHLKRLAHVASRHGIKPKFHTPERSASA